MSAPPASRSPREAAVADVIIASAAVDAMLRHAARTYPEECCGGLLGMGEGEDRVVVVALPVDNAREDERVRRYLMGPDEVRGLEAEAAKASLELVGFYHSHPDHPAEPSAFDREHAWPWYLYVIVPVQAGAAGAPRAWRLKDDRSAFDEQRITSGEETA